MSSIRALYDFVAEDESELSVAAHEQVTILENYHDGWVLAQNSSGQSVRMTPFTFDLITSYLGPSP